MARCSAGIRMMLGSPLVLVLVLPASSALPFVVLFVIVAVIATVAPASALPARLAVFIVALLVVVSVVTIGAPSVAGATVVAVASLATKEGLEGVLVGVTIVVAVVVVASEKLQKGSHGVVILLLFFVKSDLRLVDVEVIIVMIIIVVIRPICVLIVF